MRAVFALGACVVLAACARSTTESPSESSASPSPPSASHVAQAPEAGSAVTPAPVLTPEDAEEDAAHRITEQNLESELDRLEREIQAE